MSIYDDLATAAVVAIPEGAVKKITRKSDGVLVWEKPESGVQISTFSVGSSVWMNVGGIATEFIIVHHGRPSTVYDSSCNGTWLLAKDIYTKYQFAYDNPNTGNDYAESAMHDYLNGSFLNLIDSDVRDIIKQVKIPYEYRNGINGTVKSGSNGLSAKIFLLSQPEIFQTNLDFTDGSILGYFNVTATISYDRAKAYYKGVLDTWDLRTPYEGSDEWTIAIDENGRPQEGQSWLESGVRPAMIVPSNTLVSTNGFIGGETGDQPEPGSVYTFIEYIEADSGTYIDTGFVPNQDSGAILDFKLDSYSGNNFCGCRRTTSAQAFAFSTVSSRWRFGYNNSSSVSSITADANRHTVEINKNVCTLDGTVIDTNTYGAFEGFTSFTIFAIQASGIYEGSGRLYSCKLYDNGTLVRDLVPCIVRSSGEAGLYDRVNDKFYGSNGTGIIKTP